MYFRLLFTAIVYHIMNIYTAERRVEVKLPKIWTYMKSRDGKSQRREEKKKEYQRRESQKKEDPSAPKGRIVAKSVVKSKKNVAREGRQVGSLQRRVRSHEQVHAVDVKKSKSKCSKHHMFEPIFGS